MSPLYFTANIESFSDPPSRNGKIPVNDEEQTSVPHIYAIGDILEGKWELTPVAIQAGKLLARRLYAGASLKVSHSHNYSFVDSSWFSVTSPDPVSLSVCGFSAIM